MFSQSFGGLWGGGGEVWGLRVDLVSGRDEKGKIRIINL